MESKKIKVVCSKEIASKFLRMLYFENYLRKLCFLIDCHVENKALKEDVRDLGIIAVNKLTYICSIISKMLGFLFRICLKFSITCQ